MEITDKAFHEDWYRFDISIKRTFMLLIIASNLELKLSTFEKFKYNRIFKGYTKGNTSFDRIDLLKEIIYHCLQIQPRVSCTKSITYRPEF